MFASLLLAVAIWGTDPELVFSESCVPLVGSVSRSVSSLPDSDDVAISSALSQSSILRPDVVRGQSVSDDRYMPGCVPQGYPRSCCSFLQHPFVHEFVQGMNPFVDEPVRTLCNYYDPFGMQMGTGSNGSPGYRLGWVSYNDLTFMPFAAARGTTGNFSDFEWNSSIKYSEVIAPGVVFQGIGYFNARWWEGPGGVNVPGQVDQISTDLQLGFFDDGPWSAQIAFHPQIVETYEAPLDWNAFNFDGRVVVNYKASPELTLVAGLGVWDRVDKMLIPYSGVIWTPNNRWEFRILFPRTRVSYFLGNWGNADHWLYGTAEYTAEAYQSYDKQTDYSDRIQITDDRLCLGIRTDKGRYTYFFEGGWVFNRQVKFAGNTQNFNLDDTALIRVGFMY